MIPEIDVWGAANLMLKRHGERTFEESTARAEEARGRRVITGGDGLAPRIIDAVGQPANKRSPWAGALTGPVPGFAPENQVRTGLTPGGRWIRTSSSAREGPEF